MKIIAYDNFKPGLGLEATRTDVADFRDALAGGGCVSR
jgi:hypothetical protein